MKWPWRRNRGDREAVESEHAELVEVKQHYRQAKARAQKALEKLQPHIEREARRVEQLMRQQR